MSCRRNPRPKGWLRLLDDEVFVSFFFLYVNTIM
jgi:hypothetical protein